MAKHQKIAFLFPGQGAQYPGMGKDFVDNFPAAKETFSEANDILGRDISKIILEGPKNLLTETRNSQTGIYVTSMAMLRTIQKQQWIEPSFVAGLSLGEYTALAVAGFIGFASCLPLVESRGQFMNDACEKYKGTMAVIMGMDAAAVEKLVAEVNMPNDLWAANFNCPGQVAISGTLKGIQAGEAAAMAKGARGVLPLQVHGAFHSGLMKEAEEKLKGLLETVPLVESKVELVQNVTGKVAKDIPEIRRNLINQVTNPVRWEQGIRTMMAAGVDLFVEIGCGKVLTAFNKKIGVTAPTVSVEKVGDIDILMKEING